MEQNKRILVVDDDPEIRNLLSSTLSPLGLLVDTASDGEEALDHLREHSYAVVLLDLVMPHVDGFDVLNAVHTDTLPSPPVVLVITGADRSIVDKLDGSRIHGIIRKPFDPTDLGSLVLACSEIKSRGAFGTMAIATIVSGAPFLAWLVR